MHSSYHDIAAKQHSKAHHVIARLLTGALIVPVMLGTAEAQISDTLATLRDSEQNDRMTVFRTGSFLLTGTYDGGVYNVPVEGAGTRLVWYPEKAAFRAGQVTGTQWDGANIGSYSIAIGLDSRASGDYSTAFGLRSVAANTSSFAVGEESIASGAASVAMGYHAHTNARQGSFVFADRSSVDELRAGVNHSANWRVSGGFRVFTSSNLSTGVTFQSGSSTSNWGQPSAVISTSTGAFLSTGGVWTNTSDVNRKHLFREVSGEDILMKISKLPVTSWSYKTEANNIRHIGPMAQDFYAAFGLGADYRAIGTVDEAGIALAAIKALEVRTQSLSAEIENLKAENAAFRQQLDQDGYHNNDQGWRNQALVALAALGCAILAGLFLRRRSATSY